MDCRVTPGNDESMRIDASAAIRNTPVGVD